MSTTKLGLYELLAPQFLLGFSFPDYIDQYLSLLSVDELRTAADESGIVYIGRASFDGSGGASPVRAHHDPNGAIFEWDDVTLDFRLTIPRDGSTFVKTAVDTGAGTSSDLGKIRDLLDTLGPTKETSSTPTEYPGVRFRLELLVSALTFHLGKSWQPGKLSDDFRVVKDVQADQDVKFVLPKLVLEYEQGDNFSKPPDFHLKSWGNSGFDAASDLAEGELVRMEPPLALHESGRVAFSVDEILLDLSQDNTPPEILAHFGVDEAFEGLYFKSIRVYYSDKDKDLGVNFAVNDAVISFKGEVSLEAEVDILGPQTDIKVSVKLFQGKQEIQYTRGANATASIQDTGVVQVEIQGGVPPFTISAQLDGNDIWDATKMQASLPKNVPTTVKTEKTLVVTVHDSTPAPGSKSFSETIKLRIVTAKAELPEAERDGSSKDRLPDLGDHQPVKFDLNDASPPLPAGYGITASHVGGISEQIVVQGGSDSDLPDVKITGANQSVDRKLDKDRKISFDVDDGSSVSITVTYPASNSAPKLAQFHLYFAVSEPNTKQWSTLAGCASFISYVNNNPTPSDSIFTNSPSLPPGSPASHSLDPSEQVLRGAGALALQDWVKNHVVSSPKKVTVNGHASFEDDNLEGSDIALSEHRRDVAVGIIGSLADASITTATGHADAKATGRKADPTDRVSIITDTASPTVSQQVVVHATMSRPARKPSTPTTTSPAPNPPVNKAPQVFRRLSFRLRLERNVPVLMEVSGELDFETELEKRLRNASSDQLSSLELKQRQGASANPNPQDGVVDFKLNVIYDTSTHALTETFTLGAAPGDIDGLLQMENKRDSGPATAANRFKNSFGALLTLTPVINSVAASLDANSAGDWAELAVSLAVPVTIGALDVFQTQKVTLYGGELRFRELIPAGVDSVKFTDAAAVFDYSVEFGIEIKQLNIKTSKPLKVRYKAVGFNIHSANGITYQPIFDTSKGYEIDLSDPGLFNLPGALGDILKVLSARIARFNPLTLEVDLGLKVDLGVVTVDRFKVKWPLQNGGVPMILPTGVKVDISGVIVGSGYVNILDNGFEGTIDVSIVPVKVRVAASLGVQTIEDVAKHRKATAVFAGLIVEFPSPIVLAATGLGIYGFNGLFAMHYKRLEDMRQTGDSVSPALKWLEKAGGEPSKLVNNGVQLWGPELDRWSFGVGLIIGTIEGGFLINFRGMFVLELPGPRILIFVKLQILTVLPKLGDKKLTVGILAVIDLDFNLGQITVGVIIDLSIEKLIALKLSVEIFFKFEDTRNWHLYIGTTRQPATALILNIVRARGYFMFDGMSITPFPPPNGPGLPGIAVAMGIEASIVFGSEAINLYLRVAVGAHLGVAFSPFFIVGKLFFDGELHVLIISIEAHGELDAEAPHPTYIHGKVCGKIDLFFFSIEGCVEVTIGGGTPQLPAPPLVKGIYLQSHAPVITSGQGGDRPIDANLGDAVMLDNGKVPPGAEVKTVPIDTVPVIQFHGSPLVTSTTTFTETLKTSPGTNGGWINVGGGRQVQYTLLEIALDPPLPANSAKPPATWRQEKAPAPQGVDTNVDLALFSRVPVTASRALERSTDLTSQVTLRWKDLCTAVAPPTCVLWTFCHQPLGPSGAGWNLTGIALPDPPNTTRTTPPPTNLYVEEPTVDEAAALMSLIVADAVGEIDVPAKIIGINNQPIPKNIECFRVLELPYIQHRQPQEPLLQVPIQVKNPAVDNQWMVFHTGAALSATFFIAVSETLFLGRLLVLRELGANGAVLKETPVLDLSPQRVSGITNGLPVQWIDPKGPWESEVVPAAQFMAGRDFSRLLRIVFTVKPQDGCVKIQLLARTSTVPMPAFSEALVLVGAVEVCSRSEQERAAEEQLVQADQIDTLMGYLNGGDIVPLLEPNKTYTLTIHYDAVSKAADGTPSTESNLKQQFHFCTDTQEPARIDPWVLGTSPDHEEKYHFYEDTLRVLFNDVAVVQLFAAYGKKLQAVVRSADGVPLPTNAISSLDPVTATLSTPFREALAALIKAGLLPCLGSITSATHGGYTVPVHLHPLMAYTFDIVVDPPNPSDPNKPITPLYRRSFSTSRFANVTALINELRANRITHHVLKSPVHLASSPDPLDPNNSLRKIATDVDIQTALVAADEQALPAPSETGITIYWVMRAGATNFSPHFILIDASEPLWRARTEPQLKAVPNQDDPAYEIVVPQQVTAMEIIEQGGPQITQFVHSPSGTRTLAFISDTFNPSLGGTKAMLAIHRTKSDLYGIEEQSVILADIILGKAPWEDNNE